MEEKMHTPVFNIFTKELKKGGVPEKVFYLNIAFGFIAVLVIKIWSLIPIFILNHIFFKIISKKDDKLFSIISKSTLKKYFFH